ncbi:adenylate cyclase [Aureococcus anophagefferens]|nr:adenylate cyclase [Aureococcus anophagefferens]
MNCDVDKQGKTVYDGHTDKDNSCVRWATRGLWSAIGLPAAVVRSISAKVLVIDIFSLKLATHDADGKRLNPEYEYVRVCKGYENAKQLALLYRDLIVAILIYVKVKKGRAVPVVSFGLSAASFVTAHLTGLDFVDARSRKMLDRWASMTTAAREALSKKLNAANVKRWASMTTAAREALSKKLSAANVKRWASMTTAAREALCKKLKLAYDEGKMTGLVKKGETHSEATKAKMRKPKSDASNYVGNNNNTRDDTIHCYCPNPACDGGANGTAYRTSIPHQSRDFPKHFAKCSPCADFVRKALDEDDPEGVLFGSRFKWPKWLPAQQ